MNIRTANRRWVVCAALAAIPTIPFWIAFIWSGRFLDLLLENALIEQLLWIYLVPGFVVSFGLIAGILGLAGDEGAAPLIVFGGLIAIIFWGTILWGVLTLCKKIRIKKLKAQKLKLFPR